MKYEEYFDARDTDSRDRIPHVFVDSPYQHGHEIGSFLRRLFRKILSFLNKGASGVGKEALRAGINVIEDVENNKLLKKAVKSRLVESRSNLKRKATEKISSLMRRSGYKIFAKSAALQFPLGGRNRCIVHCKRRRGVKKIIEKYHREEEQKSDDKEKENLCCRKKNQKTIR